MNKNTNELSRLISLTFDESPEVRKQAAKSLGEIDDPAAIFALMELGYDKDPTVRDASAMILETRKQKEAEVMSFAEIFREKKTEAAQTGTQTENDAHEAKEKEKVLMPITRLFEKHWGKEKAEAVKSKMMPTIEKIYLKNRSSSVPHDKTAIQRTPAEMMSDTNESGRKVMQEFLTSYLEVISDLEHVGSGPTPHQHVKPIMEDAKDEKEDKYEKADEKDDGLETDSEFESPAIPAVPSVPSMPVKMMPSAALKPSTEFKTLQQSLALTDVEEMIDMRSEKGVAELPSTFFRKAYELMMLSGGDELVMKREMESMIETAVREIGLAFKLAKKKFKEAKITNLTRIKDGMRNVNTDLLVVKSIELKKSGKMDKKLPEQFYRLVVNDSGGNEGVIYLFDEKAQMVRPGMRVKITAGSAKTYGASGETVLTTGKKGNVYIVL